MEGGRLTSPDVGRVVSKTQNMLDQIDIRPMSDHLDLFQHLDRDWNGEADHLTHKGTEKQLKLFGSILRIRRQILGDYADCELVEWKVED